MDVSAIVDAVRRDAVSVLFINVLLQQLGLPVPAVPTLIVVGGLVATPGDAGRLLATAMLASLIADWVWYLAGRLFGYRVLSGLCRLSINPGSCVNATEERFVRWGMWSLVVAKFIPGFSTVAPPIAGALRMPLPGFLAATGAGAGLWAGAAIGFGWAMRDQFQVALAVLTRHGSHAIAVLLAIFGGWLAWKWWKKYRFDRMAVIPHVSAIELIRELASETPPLLLDLRSKSLVAETGEIAGAVVVRLDDLPAAVASWPMHHKIVTMCACPEDASAVLAARRLMEHGYLSVRPLKGGFDAWRAANGATPGVVAADAPVRAAD